MVDMARRVAAFGTTVFAEINDLALKHEAINLGQGSPDYDPPALVLEALHKAVDQSVHQYAPGRGYPALHEAVANHAERFYGMKVDPKTEVTVTNGATEGIFAAIMGLIDPGDEVILFEPFYDSYVPSISMAGGIARYIPLEPPDWHFDRAQLTALFSEKTRAIMINTPHNPTGKIYSEDELAFIAELCQRFDAIAITDEVYEHILFDGAQHIRMATIPGMEDRTLTISSLGKTFTTTGWKIGWTIGAQPLVTGIFRARQFVSFAVASVLQQAAIDILKAPDSFFTEVQQMYQTKRDYLFDALLETPLKPFKPGGSYFIMADTSALNQPDDYACAEYLVREVGVASIPPSSFYCKEHRHMAHRLTRFGFCKTDETLHAAAASLRNLGENVT